jgi:hypothetical protein
MRALLTVAVVLVTSTGCGSDSGVIEQPGDATQRLSSVSGYCSAHGSGSAGPDLTFAFALSFPSATTSVSFSTSGGALTDAVVTRAACGAMRGGPMVQFIGTATWAGVPDHWFVLSATDDTRRPPTAPHSFDSVRVRVVSPMGEDVFSEGGSVQSGGLTVEPRAPDPDFGSCSVDVSSIRLSANERFSLSVNDDPMLLGSASYRRTGGGPPFTFEGPATEMLCRRDGDDIADIRGITTLNGVEGYTWTFNAELRPSHVRFSVFDIYGFRIFNFEQTVADTDLQLVLRER